MPSFDDQAYDTQSYSTSAWDIVIQLLADGWKEYKRVQVKILRVLSFKAHV